MKITIDEIVWEDGKQYKDFYGNIWKVGCKDLYSKDFENITECYNLKAILEMKFKEFIDWGEVEVDTPIWIKFGDGSILRRHFAKYEDGIVYYWRHGRTSHSSDGDCDLMSSYKHVSLTELKEV